MASTEDEQAPSDQREHATRRGTEDDERAGREDGELPTEGSVDSDPEGDGPNHSCSQERQGERTLPVGWDVEESLGLRDDRDEAPCECQSGACLLQIAQAVEGHVPP